MYLGLSPSPPEMTAAGDLMVKKGGFKVQSQWEKGRKGCLGNGTFSVSGRGERTKIRTENMLPYLGSKLVPLLLRRNSAPPHSREKDSRKRERKNLIFGGGKSISPTPKMRRRDRGQ